MSVGLLSQMARTTSLIEGHVGESHYDLVVNEGTHLLLFLT
jgi:hypothetical protein